MPNGSLAAINVSGLVSARAKLLSVLIMSHLIAVSGFVWIF